MSMMVLKLLRIAKYAAAPFAFDSVGVGEKFGSDCSISGAGYAAIDEVGGREIEVGRQVRDDVLICGSGMDIMPPGNGVDLKQAEE